MHAVLWAVYLHQGMVYDLCGTSIEPNLLELQGNSRTFEKANCEEQLLFIHPHHAGIPRSRLRVATGRQCSGSSSSEHQKNVPFQLPCLLLLKSLMSPFSKDETGHKS